MNLQIVQKGTKQVGKFMMKNSPTILTGISVGGALTSLVMMHEATKKSDEILRIDAEQREKDALVEGYSEPLPITKMEVVKLTWKFYIPTAAMALTTIACIIGANSIHLRRNAALASLYSLAETALKEYQTKVVETLGERKEEKIREAITQDILDKDPVTGREVIVTGKGDCLCYDTLSSRYFMSNMNVLLKAQNEFNFDLLQDRYVTLNDFYEKIGLEHTVLGQDLGWDNEHGPLDIDFTSKIADNGEPCIVLRFRLKPRFV